MLFKKLKAWLELQLNVKILPKLRVLDLPYLSQHDEYEPPPAPGSSPGGLKGLEQPRLELEPGPLALEEVLREDDHRPPGGLCGLHDEVLDDHLRGEVPVEEAQLVPGGVGDVLAPVLKLWREDLADENVVGAAVSHERVEHLVTVGHRVDPLVGERKKRVVKKPK